MRLNQHEWSSGLLDKLLVPLLVNIAGASIFASALYYWKESILFAVLSFFALALLIASSAWLGYAISRRQLRSLCIVKTVPFRRGRRPLDVVPIDDRLNGLRDQLFFFGISGKLLWESTLFTLMQSPVGRLWSYRFLLLDPDGRALTRRLSVESPFTPDSVRHDIRSFVAQLRAITLDDPSLDVSVRFYDFSAAFWLMLCDETLYVQTFPRGGIGSEDQSLTTPAPPPALGPRRCARMPPGDPTFTPT